MPRTINDSLGKITSADGQKVSTTVKNQNLYNEIADARDFSGVGIKDIATARKTDDNLAFTPTPVPNPKPKATANTSAPSTPNSYDDISGNKEGYSPNSEGLSNTGSGAEAALGTDYSWNKQGSSQAQATYTNDVLTAKQNLLNNRQTAENNAVNYQAQADMMKYQNNQNAEKVGWTGGYVLDQNRQMDYLKASIQAQMYGAMELQKYGYDSSLAAARLSYDLNQQEYARQYYQEAVSAALSEAQLTGTYFSAETKDMMSQLSVAQQKKNDKSLSQEERDQAERLEKQIEDWFSTNGISKEGVKTLEAWQQDQANELQWSNELWTRYQAALEAANTDISENPSTFIMLDENGKEMWDGTNITTGNWETMTAQNVGDYLLSGTDKTINQQAVNQFYSYLDSTITGEIEAGYKEWCIKNGYIKENSDGNTNITSKMNEATLLQYIEESGIIDRIKNKYSKGIEDKAEYSDLYAIFQNWDFTIKMPDGTQHTYTYKDLSNLDVYRDNNGIQGSETSVDQTGGVETDSNGNVTKSGYPSFIKTDFDKAKFPSGGSIDTSHYDDDVDYDLGEGVGGGTKNYNYDIDIDWVGNNEGCASGTFKGKYGDSAADQWTRSQNYLKAAFPTAANGDLAFDQWDILWIYYNGKWGYIQQSNLGGQRLKEDMKTYLNGGTPGRWK